MYRTTYWHNGRKQTTAHKNGAAVLRHLKRLAARQTLDDVSIFIFDDGDQTHCHTLGRVRAVLRVYRDEPPHVQALMLVMFLARNYEHVWA